MSFLHPLLLAAGIAGLAIPIYVHLQMRRRRTRVVFSSLRLVAESQRIARRRRKITNWPIFLLRCLVVAMVALVFARPLIRGFSSDGLGRKETVAFVVDRSASMHARGEVGPVWEEAVEAVRQAVRRSNPASRMALITTPGHGHGAEIRWLDPQQLIRELAGVQPGYGRANLAGAIGRAASALARVEDNLPKVLHVISDLQVDAIKDLHRVTLQSNAAIRVTKVGDLEPINTGLYVGVRGTNELRRGIYGFRGTGSLGTGSQDTRSQDTRSLDNRSLDNRSLGTGGSATASGALEVQEFGPDREPIGEPEKLVPEAGKTGIAKGYTAGEGGWYSREIKLLDDDALAVDNLVRDCYYVQPRVNVLLIEPRIQTETFNQATFFFSRALDPFLAESSATNQATRFVPKTVSLAVAARTIAAADASSSMVFLPAIARVTQDLGGALRAYVEAGGGLIMFNGTDLKPALYQQYLGDLLPVTLGDVEGLEGLATVEVVTESHRLWGGLDENSRRRMSRLPLFKRSMAELTPGSELLARYSDGVPLVARKRLGQGRAIFVNTTADRQWTDWQTQGGLFVPTIHVLVSEALPPDEGQQRNADVQLTTDETMSFDVGKALSGQRVRLEKNTFVVDEQGLISDTSVNQPGVYSVGTEDGMVVRQFAANIPPTESDLESVQAVVIKRQLESQRVQTDAAIAVPTNAANQGSLIWKGILVVLALALSAEPLLANRF